MAIYRALIRRMEVPTEVIRHHPKHGRIVIRVVVLGGASIVMVQENTAIPRMANVVFVMVQARVLAVVAAEDIIIRDVKIVPECSLHTSVDCHL